MFQRALEESRRSTSTPAVAALPIKDEFSGLLGLSQSSSSDDARRKRRSSGDNVVSVGKFKGIVHGYEAAGETNQDFFC